MSFGSAWHWKAVRGKDGAELRWPDKSASIKAHQLKTLVMSTPKTVDADLSV
jgi:hypothetical protein